MADYNVNMKQWNGTSFDNVLPLAYNAKQLGGQSLAEVKQWVQDNGLLLYTGQYTGTGTYGATNPNSVTFPFKPLLIILPAPILPSISTYITIPNNFADSVGYFASGDGGNDVSVYVKIDGNTVSYYSDSSSYQANSAGRQYSFAAIGGYDMGGMTEWLITSSGSWTVPKTGRYMLELYGGGGGTPRTVGKSGYTGGSSCQHYDSVILTAGTSFNVTIGKAGVSSSVPSNVKDGGSTTFGSYSVSGGGKATTSAAGSGAGNYGKSGIYVSSSIEAPTTNDGFLGSIYGVGSGGRGESVPATAGAVYLKYLGD